MKKIGRPPVPVQNRFWSKVDKTPGHGPWGDCWIWTAATSHGYGLIGHQKKTHAAHRISYWMSYPKWDLYSDVQVNHSCDNRPCVNPTHLHLGTHASNMREMAERGRACGGSPRKLTAEEIVTYKRMMNRA